MKNGADMAVADINAAGGVSGKKLALDAEDDACDPKQACSVAEKIGSSKIPFVPAIIARRHRSPPPRPMPTATCCR